MEEMNMKELYLEIFGNTDDTVTIGNMEVLQEKGFEFEYSAFNAEVRIFKNDGFIKNVSLYFNDEERPDPKDWAEEVLKLFDEFLPDFV